MIKRFSSWIITVVAVVILFWICSLFIESHDALKWPQTKGQVISSLLTIKHLPKFIDFNADPLRWYGVDVRYQYSVDDRTYISNRIAIQDSGTGISKNALKLMNKYRHQHGVVVFYNPANPQQAVLEPWNIGDIYIPLVMAGLLVFLWLVIFSDQSVEINIPKANDYLYWGKIYQKQGKLDEALNEYDKIIETSSHTAIGYVNRGNIYLQQGKWDLAIADFKQAISIDPTAAIVYFNRAQAYLGTEQYDKAWVDMQKAMERGYKIKPEILEKVKKHL